MLKDNLACINFYPRHNKKDTIAGKAGILLTVSIIITPIDENGDLLSKKGWGIDMHWKEEDLKITKPSLKLLEKLMKKTVEKKLSISGTFGVPFNELIDLFLNPKKINLSDYYTPLSELI